MRLPVSINAVATMVERATPSRPFASAAKKRRGALDALAVDTAGETFARGPANGVTALRRGPGEDMR